MAVVATVINLESKFLELEQRRVLCFDGILRHVSRNFTMLLFL
jgi:hypothetical protein